jgi:hypothetical protein
MASEFVEQVISRAVQQAYDDWAAEHPSLAAVIDHIAVVERAATSLRRTDGYRAAVAAYHDSRNELDLIDKLAELATPIIRSVLGL